MNRRSSVRPRGADAGPALAAALGVALAMIALPGAAAAQAGHWSYDQDLRLSYEYDDNVREELTDPVQAQIAKFAYRGDVQWGDAGQQHLALTYQGGFKRHFGLISREQDIKPQFVNEGSIDYERRITDRLALGGTFGLKNRKWLGDFFFINEDGFTRVNGGVSAMLNLVPVAPGGAVRLEVGANWRRTNFENLDQAFGSHGKGAYVNLTKQFGDDVTAEWSYSFDQARYPGRGTLEPGDDPQAIFGPRRDRQEDHLHELGARVTWLGPVSIQASYEYRLNDSNSFGFSYFSHNAGIQVLRRLPWGLLAQVYGQVELRSFSEPVPNVTAGSLDTGEAQNNVFLLRMVKDVSRNYSIEVRYGRYRNESITLNDFYTKNVYAVGVNYRP